MAYCSIVGCNNKQANNSEVTYFNWSNDPQRQKSWLAAICRDKAIYHQMFLFVLITLKTNILINHGIYKTKFFTQTDQ